MPKPSETARLLTLSARDIVLRLRDRGWTLAEIGVHLSTTRQHIFDISTGRRGVGESHLRTLQRLAVEQKIL